MQGNANRIRTAPQGAFGRNKSRGIFAYTVACVGLFDTVNVTVRLRSPTLFDVARNTARTLHKGALSYSVVAIERE